MSGSNPAHPAPLRVWLKGSHLIGIAGLLAAIVLTLSLAFIQFGRNQRQQGNLLQLQQLAKLMARQTATDINAVESMLLVLATSDADWHRPNEPGQIDWLVGSVVRGYPQLRSVSLLDEGGRVMASTSPGNLGIQADMSVFGVVPRDSLKPVIGRILAGRDLPDIQRRTAGASKLNVLPMLVRLRNAAGQDRILVALLNADYFSSVYEASANDSTIRVALVSYEGELLTGTSNVARAFGSSLNQLRLFQQFLPSREWGSYVGPGLDDQNVSTAFSVLPKWPMALIAESSLGDVMIEVERVEKWTLILVSTVLSVILALTVVTARSLKRHTSINEELYQEVLASEARQRAMFESSIDGILTIDAAGDVVDFNPAAERIFGRVSADIVGKPMHEFLVPANLRHDHQQGIRRFVASGDGPVPSRLNRRIETIGLRSDGSTFPIELTIVSTVVGGQTFFTSTVRDIGEKKRIEIALAQARESELEIGTRIQQTLLAASPLQQEAGVWLSCFNQASKGIDGDFVEVIKVGEHCVDIIAGDVMGKGVPAALMGAATKLQFSRSLVELLSTRTAAQEAPQPIDILSSVHRTMTPHLQLLEVFVTLCYIRIDRMRNIITWVGCGHEEALVIHSDGRTKLLPNQHPPLGVLQSVEFVQDVCPISAGDALFLCSDGLADAVLPSGERIGRDLINTTVRQLVREHGAPGAALHSLRRILLPEDVRINDDVSLVLVMLPSAASGQEHCELAIEMEALRAFREFVTLGALRSGMSEADTAMFELASVEVFTNIVRHGVGLLAGAPVELVTHCERQEFVLEVIYLGDAYTPPEEVAETNFDVFPEGGFGLTIIRNACDRAEYLHHQGVNTVRLRRHTEA